MDCDNDHSESPDEWVTPEEKRGKAPRSKFHVLFLIEEMTDPAEYSALKKRVNNIFCFPFSHCSNCSPYSRYTSF